MPPESNKQELNLLDMYIAGKKERYSNTFKKVYHDIIQE